MLPSTARKRLAAYSPTSCSPFPHKTKAHPVADFSIYSKSTLPKWEGAYFCGQKVAKCYFIFRQALIYKGFQHLLHHARRELFSISIFLYIRKALQNKGRQPSNIFKNLCFRYIFANLVAKMVAKSMPPL
jgi:hypothetical protein